MWDEVLGPNGFLEQRGSVGVLLIHGLTGTPAEMKHFGRQLAKKGYSVACPQLAGHCTSIGALKATHWRDWYGSVERAFELMSQTYEKVFVGGLSMGALLALLLAADHKKRVSGVILLSTTFFYDGWNVPKLSRKFLLPLVLHTPLKHFVHWKETSPYGIKCERTRARVAAILSEKSAVTADKIGYFKTPATVILESTYLIRAARNCLSNVITPTLIVHSTEDDIASLKSAHYVSNNIAARHVETYFVDDTYHVLTLDKRKDDIARRVATFCHGLSLIKFESW